jgi:ABC-type glycerol-3-phosphate transport system substrate-binding protein
MKKMIAIILIAGMIAVILASCGENNEDAADATTTTAASGEDTQENIPAEEVKIEPD